MDSAMCAFLCVWLLIERLLIMPYGTLGFNADLPE